MDRRDFLDPRQLAELVGPVLAIADELEPPVGPDSEPVMLRFARRAMATTFEVIFPFDTPLASDKAQLALDEIDRIESQLTAYRDTSEVSRLDGRAAHHPVHVERPCH